MSAQRMATPRPPECAMLVVVSRPTATDHPRPTPFHVKHVGISRLCNPTQRKAHIGPNGGLLRRPPCRDTPKNPMVSAPSNLPGFQGSVLLKSCRAPRRLRTPPAPGHQTQKPTKRTRQSPGHKRSTIPGTTRGTPLRLMPSVRMDSLSGDNVDRTEHPAGNGLGHDWPRRHPLKPQTCRKKEMDQSGALSGSPTVQHSCL